MYIYVYMCVYIYIYIYVYTYVYKHTFSLSRVPNVRCERLFSRRRLRFCVFEIFSFVLCVPTPFLKSMVKRLLRSLL